ncbi:hypothetical protein Ddc_14100 [Ditylenchus destructor]|nr:hypothetical protein Ddc_14100 [Ditylenchus destructor]
MVATNNIDVNEGQRAEAANLNGTPAESNKRAKTGGGQPIRRPFHSAVLFIERSCTGALYASAALPNQQSPTDEPFLFCIQDRTVSFDPIF